MIAEMTAAFRAGTDDPVRALREVRDDRAILWRVPAARADAEASRERYRSGTPRGPLDGIAVAVKDCIDVAGLPSTNGTKFLMQPAASDAVVVERLRAAGAVVFAKTNMHEFGIQPTGINPHHGTPVNRWDARRIPGGSSSGSAVAVATGIVPIAVGTDAGGSVRIPAAVNGLVGLKPTFGAIPMQGVAELTVDLDHVGAIATNVEDATLLFEVLSQRTVGRGASVDRPALLSDFLEGTIDGIAEIVRNAARDVFPNADEVRSPLCTWAAAVEFVIVGTDVQTTCAPYVRDHAADLGADTRVILRLGGGLSRDDRDRADRLRTAMRAELDALLATYDVLIAPATGSLPPILHRSARKYGELDPATMGRFAAQAFVANLTGHPSVVVPCVRDGLPVAMQIIGRRNDEARILRAAAMVEERYLRNP